MESTRLHPIGHLERLCRKEYTFKGTNTTIKPGTLVMIPTVNMMKDSKYFEDPLKFDPTRWSKEGESTKNPFLHFTFGKDTIPLDFCYCFAYNLNSIFRSRSKELHRKAVCHVATQDGSRSLSHCLQVCGKRENYQSFKI